MRAEKTSPRIAIEITNRANTTSELASGKDRYIPMNPIRDTSSICHNDALSSLEQNIPNDTYRNPTKSRS